MVAHPADLWTEQIDEQEYPGQKYNAEQRGDDLSL